MTELSVIMFGYPKCGTCRSAQKWLEQAGLNLQVIDISINPPTVEQLKSYMALGDLPVSKLFNTSGILYKEMKLKDKLPHMELEEKLRLLSENGMLVKRPIVSDGSKVTVGYREEEYQQVWGI